jgi:curved DNA-binding protein CbpA
MESNDFELLKNINLYDILGFVSRNDFTTELAKKNYRKLALKYHPDKNPNESSNEKFELIQLAYLILMSPEYKEKYENVYDSNSQIKDFKDLKETVRNDNFKIERITKDDFSKKISKLNIKNKDNVSFEIPEILDQETAQKKTLDMLKERKESEDFFKEIYKETHESLSKFCDQNEINKKFNEIFDEQTELSNNFNLPSLFDQSDITIYNGNDVLCNYTTLSNMSYDSMYADKSLYDETFNISNIPKYINDNKTLEQRMKDYMTNSQQLAQLAKNSNVSNMNTAVYKN